MRVGAVSPVYHWPGLPRQNQSVRSSILTNLVSYWKLEEASGTRNDTHGTNHLTATNTPGNAAGKLSNAVALVRASTQHLNIASNSDLQTGAASWNFGAWVYMSSKPAGKMTIAGKHQAGTTEWWLWWNNVNDRFEFQSNGAGTALIVANTFGAPSLSTWYYVEAGRDHAGTTAHLSVNGGTRDTTASPNPPTAGADRFYIGALNGGSTWDGRIDSAIWRKGSIFTTGEITSLYNAGSGLEYPFS